MNPYELGLRAKCEVCGGAGRVRAVDVRYLYLGPFRHIDPRYCDRVREVRRRDTERKQGQESAA